MRQESPALLGAALYIGAVYLLCLKLTPQLSLQWPVFVCLVYNPFIFDYLVAARGYALALGFLLCSFAIAAYSRLDEPACALCSVCASLSFAANFSFAFVNAFALLAIFLWACARTQAIQTRVRLLGACVLPGALVSVFVSLQPVLHWPEGQLSYGAHSLHELFFSVAHASLYRINPLLANPMVFHLLTLLKPRLLPGLLVLAGWQWIRWRTPVSLALLGILAATILTHWLLLKLRHVPLPMDRTAIWIVPLLVLAIAAAAVNRRGLTVALYLLSFYFVFCLRLNYFKEWEWDADVNRIYPVLAWYNHTYGVRDVASEWRYGASLNFYRVQSGRESIGEIECPVELVPGHAIYVLCWPFDEGFIHQQHLRVVYRAPNTDAVVAIRPDVEDERARQCRSSL